MIVTQIRDKLLEQGHLATGDLYNSITYGITKTNDIVSLSIYANDYFKWIDQGVRPGGKQPPPDKILKWVQTRGLRPKPVSGIPSSKSKLPRTDRSLAFLIGRSISLRGIKPGNILSPIITSSNDQLTSDISQIIVSAITQIIGEGFENLASQVTGDLISIKVNYPKN